MPRANDGSMGLGRIELQMDARDGSPGAQVLGGILRMAEATLAAFSALAPDSGAGAVGRLRGSGRGIHFNDLMVKLESEHPLHLIAPFENSPLVSGAAWEASQICRTSRPGALAKLRWEAHADDLPMHVHEHSDRFIIVHSGRGYFHVSDQSVEAFDGSDVRSIPARERDVFLFTRGTIHTFSTAEHPMVLLSCQLPYLAFDDPRQYRLPAHIWTARDNPERSPTTVGCDPAWTVLAGTR
jgi:mannose-6-phosphate isomerase-like protein (cupin superfamily)